MDTDIIGIDRSGPLDEHRKTFQIGLFDTLFGNSKQCRIVTEEEKSLYKKLAHRKEMSLTDLIKSLLNAESKKENLSLDDLKKK